MASGQDPAKLTELDARMLIRAGERAAVRDRWNIGEPYADEPVATVTVAARHSLGLSREYLTGRLTGHEEGGIAARLAGAVAGFFRIAANADKAPSSGSLEDMAMAAADALHEARLVSRDAAAVQLDPAWNARVSPGELLYTSSPEGTGILAARRGDDPFEVTTQIRTLWR